MKRYLNLSFSLFLFIVIISSCTMEKRLYRSGYHIEFKKNKGTTLPESDFTDDSKNESLNNSIDSYIPVIEINEEIETSENHTKNLILSNRQPGEYVNQSEIKFIQNNFSLNDNGINKKKEITTVNDKATKQGVKNMESPFQKKDDDTDRGRGIYMMLMALALFGLGYLFYSLLGTIGLVFFWIFGIGAGVFFVLGLLYVIFG